MPVGKRLASTWSAGPVFAVVGILGFSFKAILIKLAYTWAPVDAVTLLTLRMLYSMPFFVVMAWWASRPASVEADAPSRLAGAALAGIHRLLPLQPARFHGPAIHHRVARAPGAVPLSDDGRAAFGGCCSSSASVAGYGPRSPCPTPASFSSSRTTCSVSARRPRRLARRGACVRQRVFLLAIPGRCGPGHHAPREPELHRVGNADVAVFVIAQFVLTRPLAALAAPASIQWLSLTMAVFSTVLPTFLIAEAIKRMGANRTSLIGSLGPVFTIGLGWWILGEGVHWVQLVGAALVLGGSCWSP